MDGWGRVMASVIDAIPRYDEIIKLQTAINNGVIKIKSANGEQYYYESVDPVPVIDGNAMKTKITVDPMQDSSIEILLENLIQYGSFASITDGVVEEVELDERLRVVGEVVDDELWLGFETADGSNLNEYDGVIPNAIVYKNIRPFYFVIH